MPFQCPQNIKLQQSIALASCQHVFSCAPNYPDSRSRSCRSANSVWFLDALHQRPPVNVKSDSSVFVDLCGHGRPSHPLHTDPGNWMLPRNPRSSASKETGPFLEVRGGSNSLGLHLSSPVINLSSSVGPECSYD